MADAGCQVAPQQVRAAAAAAAVVADLASAMAVSYVCCAWCYSPWVAHGSIDLGSRCPTKGNRERRGGSELGEADDGRSASDAPSGRERRRHGSAGEDDYDKDDAELAVKAP